MHDDIYKVEIQFDGVNWTEVEIVNDDQFVLDEILHKDLQPADRQISFNLLPNESVYNSLRVIGENTPARVTKNGVRYFTGYVKKDFDIAKIRRIQKCKVDLISASFLLKRKIGVDLSYTNKTVTTLIANLLTSAGISSYTLPTISTVVPGFYVNATDGKTYHDIISKLLFQYGYTFNFDKDDKVYCTKLFPDTLTSVGLLDGTTNRTQVVQKAKPETYEAIDIKYYPTKTLTNTVVFADTSGAKDGYKCFITLPKQTYLNGQQEWDAELKIADGDILATTGLSHSILKDPNIQVLKFQPKNGNKVTLSIYNASTLVDQNIYKNDITASTVVVKLGEAHASFGDMNTQRWLSYEAEFIHDQTSAQALASGLKGYYEYSDFSYEVKSYVEYNIGDIVDVSEQGLGTNTCRIVQKKTNENMNLFSYVAEAINEYSVQAIKNALTVSAPVNNVVVDSVKGVVDTGLNNDGTVKQPVDATKISGTLTSTTGLGLDSNYIGFRKNGSWTNYFKSDGTLNLSNKLVFDGTNLSVYGAIESYTGKIANFNIATNSLTSGSGSTTVGIDSGGTNPAFYAGSSTPSSAPFRVSNAGALTTSNITATGGTLSNLTVNGTLTIGTGGLITGTGYSLGPTTSTIGGFSIGASTLGATNLLLTSGVANVANITVGTGSFSGGLNAGNISTDILIWAGNTYANRAIAPFRVNASGSMNATAGTIGGFTLSSSTLYGGNVTLNSAGSITVGTSNNVATLSSSDATYRLWVGNAASTSAPFRVAQDGTMYATQANISGTVNSSGGAIGGWLIGTNTLSSASTGQKMVLDQSKWRASWFDSAGIEKIVIGGLEGQPKNSGTGSYTSTDYGIWVKSGDSVKVDGPMDILNGDMAAHDATFKVFSGTTEVARLGSDTGTTGLHLYHTNGAVRLYNGGNDDLVIKSDSGYGNIGSRNSSWFHFFTDRPSFYFDKPTSVNGAISVYGTSYGISSSGALTASSIGINGTSYGITGAGALTTSSISATTISGTTISGTTISGTNFISSYSGASSVDLNTLTNSGFYRLNASPVNKPSSAEDWSQMLVIHGGSDTIAQMYFGYSSHDIWSRSGNPSNTGGAGTWGSWRKLIQDDGSGNVSIGGKLSVANGTGTDSDTVYIKDSNGQLKEKTINNGVWSYNYNQNLKTTDSPTFSTLNATGTTALYQSKTLNETTLKGTDINLWGSGSGNNYQIRGHNIALTTTGTMAVTHGVYADVRGYGEGDWGRTVGFEAFMAGGSSEQFAFVGNADNYFQGTTVSRAFATALNNTSVGNITFTATPSTTGGSIPIGTYYYTITAIDSFGGESTRLQYIQATTTTATSKVTLSWNAVLGATAYKIYRNNAVNMHFSYSSYIGTTTGTSLVDTLATPTAGFPRVYGVTGVLNIIDGTKAQFGVPTKIANTTASTSSTTGALVVNGGVGVAGDMNVAGSLNVDSHGTTGSNVRNITISTASPTGGSSGDIWITY